jgi:hypothetical protein
MITGIDHVVILVDDLAAVTAAYEHVGFDVVRGGEHPRWGTENALIALADGTYLELLAARDRLRAAGHRLWMRPEGQMREPGEYGGFMVGTGDLVGDVRRLRARGIPVSDPTPGARVRPDGQQVRWRLAFAERWDLPALIEDETPRHLRVPAPVGLNRRVRLAEVVVAVPDLQGSARAYAALAGVTVETVHGGTPAARRARVRFADPAACPVVLTQPAPGDELDHYMGRVGPGVGSITLEIGRWTHHPRARAHGRQGQGAVRRLDPDRTGGVSIFVIGRLGAG